MIMVNQSRPIASQDESPCRRPSIQTRIASATFPELGCSKGSHRRKTLRRVLTGLALALALSTGGTGCVKKSLYDQAQADLGSAKEGAGRMAQHIAKVQGQVDELQADIDARDAELAEAATAQADMIKKLDELALLNAELSERLRKAGHSVEQLADQRGSLTAALEATRKKLEELHEQQAIAEERAAQFRELTEKFAKMVDAGQLRVAMRDGRMLVELPNSVLFDSGNAAVKPAGKTTLQKVAGVLKKLEDRKFQVAGHTDNVKIQSSKYPSNWDLSAKRAVNVTRLLVDYGMDPKTLSAAGYGEHAPAASNDTAAERAKNRRIEIALVPDLREMVQLPEARVDGTEDKTVPQG